jgi:hypothetical protein
MVKGGARWRQGADTCVLKPNAACKEDPVGFPRNMPNMISRIVQRNTYDVLFESLIKTNFPSLVERGLVVVYTKACSPVYAPDNLKIAPNINPGSTCIYLDPGDLNLITPEYSDTYYNWLVKKHNGKVIQFERARELLRGAICAAIDLVPDSTQWVIHGDLHMNNILVKQDLYSRPPIPTTVTALADWGRTIAFNPYEMDSVYEGLKRYLKIQSHKFGPFYNYFELISHPNVAAGQVPQISVSVFYTVHEWMSFFERGYLSSTKFTTMMGALRGFMVYTLMKQLYVHYKLPYPPNLTELLTTKSQLELIEKVNSIVPPIVGEPYYKKDFAKAETAASGYGPVLAPAVSAGPTAGGKQTRRTKRKQKKKSLKNRS